jgi:hypothetical protein
LVFIDVIIAIGLLDSGCVKLWAFDPRTATSTVRIKIFVYVDFENICESF